MENCKIVNLYNLDETIAKDLLTQYLYPWEVLPHISEYILELGGKLPKEEYDKIGENVWIHKTAKVFESAYIHGPAIICKNAEIRHCAFIRGNAIVGEGAVVGNSTELKNCSILSDCIIQIFVMSSLDFDVERYKISLLLIVNFRLLYDV